MTERSEAIGQRDGATERPLRPKTSRRVTATAVTGSSDKTPVSDWATAQLTDRALRPEGGGVLGASRAGRLATQRLRVRTWLTTPMSNPVTPHYATAIHESSHVVCALSFGLQVDRLSIRADGFADVCSFRHPSASREQIVSVFLAGVLGERLIAPCTDVEVANTDAREAAKFARGLDLKASGQDAAAHLQLVDGSSQIGRDARQARMAGRRRDRTSGQDAAALLALGVLVVSFTIGLDIKQLIPRPVSRSWCAPI